MSKKINKIIKKKEVTTNLVTFAQNT